MSIHRFESKGVRAALRSADPRQVGLRSAGADDAVEIRDEVSQSYFNHVVELNRLFGEQIRAADQKAAYIFTFLIALLASSGETRHAFLWALYQQPVCVRQLVSGALAVSLTLSLVAAVCTVLPRRATGRSLMFWGAWPEAAERLLDGRRSGQPDFLFDDYLENARTLAELCVRKYRCVHVGFRALLVMVLSYVGLLALG